MSTRFSGSSMTRLTSASAASAFSYASVTPSRVSVPGRMVRSGTTTASVIASPKAGAYAWIMASPPPRIWSGSPGATP